MRTILPILNRSNVNKFGKKYNHENKISTNNLIIF